MNPHASFSISPWALLRTLNANKNLAYNMAKREVMGRYKGSAMGLLWSFVNPVLMLAVYTFVFSVVFNARWSGGVGSKTEFALVLFAGLLVFNFFSECINRAPLLIISNVNYVKKVVFPLEILPVVVLGAAAFHFLVSLAVWLLFYVIFFGIPTASILMLPVALLPLVFLTIGISWLLASLGTYIRDIGQVIGMVTMVLMFMSPIFYPVAALPVEYHAYMQLSPLTFVIEQARDVMIWAKPINWGAWSIWMVVSLAISWLGFAWFQKTRKGFADVL